jgi:AcrR family transcriptional regulator
MGRPREFDTDEALCKALQLFWKQGYEGTSLSDLTEAMGINRPSLYAAFGNKEELFLKALDRYAEHHMAFFGQALAAPTAREAVSRLLHGFVDAQTDQDSPAGCLGTNGAIACSVEADAVRQELIQRRGAAEHRLEDRLRAAWAEGDLPPDQDPADLARFVMTIAQGTSVQAASGVDRDSLHRVVESALRAWPSR